MVVVVEVLVAVAEGVTVVVAGQEITAPSGSPKHPRKRSSIAAGEIPASALREKHEQS